MGLSTLTNSEIVAALKTLTGNEREVLVKILFHLIELENRKAYRELGYSCLFEYCVGALKYSHGAAGRRTRAAEVLRSNPEVEALLLSGELTLSAVVAAAEVIKTQEVAVSEITSKSAREVELFIAHTCPKAFYLELDHIVPFAAGGLTTEENLRLLCPALNQLAAEEYFGKAFMDKKVSANYFQR